MSDSTSTINTLSLPPLAVYPERPDSDDNWLNRIYLSITSVPVVASARLRAIQSKRIVSATKAYSDELKLESSQALQNRMQHLRADLRSDGLTDQLIAETFALVQEFSQRTIGMRHYDVQLIGGLTMLRGRVAEMETGEGKTLTATLPACTAALAGMPVHIITVNDYLAQRDAREMQPIYQALGLSVGVVIQGMSPEQRRAAYRCDVTYCTNKEVAFDYLRDRLVLAGDTNNVRLKLEQLYEKSARCERLVMRGLHFAIVDEADSVLIDEARTPLIISGQTDPQDETRNAQLAFELISDFQLDRDYQILTDEKRIEITTQGETLLKELTTSREDLNLGKIRCLEAARQALAAKHLFKKDEHYLVRDNQVQIIDEYSGRVMPDRSWNQGLHQLVEFKEGCEITGQKVPLARMTYQRFFRRYKNLSGMTGTAREVANELWAVYMLPVVKILTHRPLRRAHSKDQIFPTLDSKWSAIAGKIKQVHETGQPVLLGTRSVAASETAARYLSRLGLDYVILNAAQDEAEAEVIARAGRFGSITIATNMAGRGVDIKLANEVKDKGGLHVIVSELHEAGRIDRQLIGRCARQGEPGSYEAMLSYEDPLLDTFGNSIFQFLIRNFRLFKFLTGRWVLKLAQQRAEHIHSAARKQLVKYDQKLNTILSFSGKTE